MTGLRFTALLAAAATSIMIAATGATWAGADENIQVVRDLLSDLTGTADVTDTHHEDVVFRNPTGVFAMEDAAANADAIAAAFPDMRADIISIEGGDDWVIVHYTLSGTFLNDLPNPADPDQMVPANGNSFSVDVHTAFIFDGDGLITHEVQSLNVGLQERQLFGQ
ncbi:MAG: hypothetical protein ACI9MU_004591 [Alphaproteobacteria bacterium]|jgi:hypothetical protein